MLYIFSIIYKIVKKERKENIEFASLHTILPL